MTDSTAAPLAQNPLLARAAVHRHLLAPDGAALIDDEGRPAAPAAVALALALALAGGSAFGLVLSLAGGGGSLVGTAPAVLGGVALAGLLTFPPLYLLTALRGRDWTADQLLASAAVGPAVLGLWLAAGAPLLLLYTLTRHPGPAWSLLALGLSATALLAGAIAVVRRARRGGPDGPGTAVLLGHYLLTAWTALVLVSHLA